MIYAYVAVLTVIDLGCTYIGFTRGFIEEANPLLKGVYEKEPLIASICILIFMIVCLWLISKVKKKWVKYALHGVLFIKVCIVLLHADWIMKVM